MFLLFFTAGCSNCTPPEEWAPDVEVAPAVNEVFRGSIVFGHEVRSFRPCGEEETFWVVDQTGILWDLHRDLAPDLRPYQEVFFVLLGRRGPPPKEGFGADYAGELSVTEILYASLEGFSCETEWTKFNYRVFGNEPFWSAEVNDDNLELRRLNEPNLGWKNLQIEETRRGTIRYSEESEQNLVSLELFPEPCRDSMSGAFFSYTATLRLGLDELHGCALKGYPTD